MHRYPGEVDRDAYDRAPGERWSLLRHLRRSPLHYQHAVKTVSAQSAPMRFGSAAHCVVFEPDQFDRRYVVYSESKCKGEGARKKWEAFQEENAHKTILSPEEYDRAQFLGEAVRRHPYAAALLLDGRAEVPLTWTDPRTGLSCKCRLDWVTPEHAVVDLKSARNLDERAFAAQAWRLAYFQQMDYYRSGLGANLKRSAECVPVSIIAVESEAPFDVAVFQLDDESMIAAREEVERLINTLLICRRDNVWPGRYVEPFPLVAPAYALDDGDDDWSVTTTEG